MGQHSRMLLICLGGPRDSMGFYSYARYKFMCSVLYVLWLACVCSRIFIRLGRGGAAGGWVSVVSSLSVVGDMAVVSCVLLLHLCILVLVLLGRMIAT